MHPPPRGINAPKPPILRTRLVDASTAGVRNVRELTPPRSSWGNHGAFPLNSLDKDVINPIA